MMKSIQIVGDTAYGGAIYLLKKWCQYLVAQQCSVDILATNVETVSALEAISGVRVIQDIYIPREISPTTDAVAFFKLLRLLRREKYHVVHTYTATPGFLGRIAAKLAAIPIIFHHQAGWTVAEYTSPIHRIFYTPIEYVAALVSTRSICVSHAVAEQALQFHTAPKRKLVTICNGIDPQPFVIAANSSESRQRFRSELGISEECLLLGGTGRLAEGKDNVSLIKALILLKQLLGSHPFKLLLVGDGPQRLELEALVARLGLDEHVRFLGFCQNVPEFLTTIDIYITPSLREGLSIALLEAMATAKPIIATSILPNAELIKHEHSGLLVEPGSPEQIAAAVKRFAHDPDFAQYCALQAQQRVLSDYTLDRMLEETWTLYRTFWHEKQ